jgi:hypothetical protein
VLPKVSDLPTVSSGGLGGMFCVLTQMAPRLAQLILVDLGPEESQDVDDLDQPVRQVDRH